MGDVFALDARGASIGSAVTGNRPIGWECPGCSRRWAPHVDCCRVCDAGATSSAPVNDRSAPALWELARQWRRALGTLTSRKTAKPLKISTRRLYLRHLKPLLLTRVETPDRGRVRMGHLRWDELSKRAPDYYRIARTKAPRTDGPKGLIQDNTVNRELTTLMAMLTWHIDAGANLGRNPIHGARMVSEKQFRRKTRLSWGEFSDVIAEGHPLMQDIASVAFRCVGMRPSEVRLLLKTEVDTQRHMIVLTDREGAKTGPRAIPIPDDAWEIIERRARESRGPYVFVAPWDPKRVRPISASTLAKQMRTSRSKSTVKGAMGERLTLYVARHSGINAPLSAGEQPAHVAAAAGASYRTIEENYLTVLDSDHERMRTTLNGMIAWPAGGSQTAEPRRPPRAVAPTSTRPRRRRSSR